MKFPHITYNTTVITPQANGINIITSPKPRIKLTKLHENDIHMPTRKTELNTLNLKEMLLSFSICFPPNTGKRRH
jgi:hypothetical protein